MNFEKLEEQVLAWAGERNLLNKDNIKSQALKMVSEVGELCDGIVKGNEDEVIDGIGDVIITLIILAKQMELNPVLCLNVAYQEIKNRKGKTIDGAFVKNQ